MDGNKKLDEINEQLIKINNSLDEIKPKKKKPLSPLIWITLWSGVALCIYIAYVLLSDII